MISKKENELVANQKLIELVRFKMRRDKEKKNCFT